MKSWFKDLSKGGKVTVVGLFGVFGIVLLSMIGGGSNQSSSQFTDSNLAKPITTNVKAAETEKSVEVKTITETESIPFDSATQEDGSLAKGTTQVAQTGINGEKKVIYEVTYVDGKEANRKKLSESVTKSPTTQITKVGTYTAPAAQSSNCDPNYSGACVPIASDVDCAGGSGNGPAYVRGPVYVIGNDIYGLDGRDNDGIGCE